MRGEDNVVEELRKKRSLMHCCGRKEEEDECKDVRLCRATSPGCNVNRRDRDKDEYLAKFY